MSPEVAGDDFGGAGVGAVGPPGFVSAPGVEEAFTLGFVRVAEGDTNTFSGLLEVVKGPNVLTPLL